MSVFNVQEAVELLDDKFERRDCRQDLIFRGIPLVGNEPVSTLLSLAGAIMTADGVAASEANVEYVRVLNGSSMPLVRFATVAMRAVIFINIYR